MPPPEAPGEPHALRTALADDRARTTDRLLGLERDRRAIVDAAAVDPPDDEHDPEGATTAFERQQLAALIAAARTRLVELDEAAARLEAGTAGVCVGCGGAIGGARQRARPTARHCVRCAGAPRR